MAGLVLVVILGAVLTSVVMARVRARARADWLQGQNLTMAPVVKGLKEPTFVAFPPDGSKRLFVVERDGPIRVAGADGQIRSAPLLDLTGEVSTSTEQGLFSLAFDPRFVENGYVYVAYTAQDNAFQLIRYTVSGDSIDPSTASTVLSLPKKSKYHNGGMLQFGPDGYLYVAVGDDEDSNLAQALDTPFGKILRIDVDSAEPYAIPESNPFAQVEGARAEIWSYGLRNPWRFSFDRATGDMWIADVGDARWEEVDFQPAASGGGENYGYPMNEGTECMLPERCHAEGLVAPVVTYGHDMLCSVTGGYVYRGREVGGLTGGYIFGDLCTGGIFAVRPGTSTRLELSFSPIKISSFGEDQSGELYVCDMQGGVIYRIVEGSLP
jgi:glucose/arabinose dehydrogenase